MHAWAGTVKLLPKSELIVTSSVDHADWNYRPLLSALMRRRFALIERLLPPRRISRLLEVGFGSGIFLPELATKCEELYGIDIHDHVPEVQAALARRNVSAVLSQQSAASMTFPDAFFDVIVSVSALEFITDMDSAACELARVLTRDGVLVAVMPVKSGFLDGMVRVLTGADPRLDYEDRRERVLPALLREFQPISSSRFAGIYRAYALERT